MACRPGTGGNMSTPVQALLAKGVRIPNPHSVTIRDDVDPDRISGDGVVIHPGCRIGGAKTVISAGVHLGAQGPVTLLDCRLGPDVALAGGYAAKAVFLRGAAMGLGHHVREGCLLEERSGAAHAVGLKQTILFPYARLGALINFCDCLLAGGTGPEEHSDVGSSYIHFNFTPSGDKTTPSMYGDVPRGVLLAAPPVVLGGQGGTVGPVRVGYGSVVAAGTVVRGDVGPGVYATVAPPATRRRDYRPGGYPGLLPLVDKNLSYLAGLRALEEWYRVIRQPFFAAQQLGELVYEGALEMLALAWAERVARLTAMLAKVGSGDELRAALSQGGPRMCAAAAGAPGPREPARPPSELVAVMSAAAARGTDYLSAVRELDPATGAAGTAWLRGIIDDLVAAAYDVVPGVAAEPAAG